VWPEAAIFSDYDIFWFQGRCPVTLRWSDIFVEASELEGMPLFEHWPYTVRGQLALIGASAFGDLFFVRLEGIIECLDVLEGGVHQVAPNFEEYMRLRDTQEWQESMLLSQGVAFLAERGISRGSQQFYGFAPHPVWGGRIDWAHVMPLDAIVWHSICAQALDASRAIPNGAGHKVTGALRHQAAITVY
jgi:hypothetical protein